LLCGLYGDDHKGRQALFWHNVHFFSIDLAQSHIYETRMQNEFIQKYEQAASIRSLSLSELCAAAGVADSTISRWRNGRRPQGRTLRKLDDFLAKGDASTATHKGD
jgi:hypothetical protein